jgi:hypothetical protein
MPPQVYVGLDLSVTLYFVATEGKMLGNLTMPLKSIGLLFFQSRQAEQVLEPEHNLTHSLSGT